MQHVFTLFKFVYNVILLLIKQSVKKYQGSIKCLNFLYRLSLKDRIPLLVIVIDPCDNSTSIQPKTILLGEPYLIVMSV